MADFSRRKFLAKSAVGISAVSLAVTALAGLRFRGYKSAARSIGKSSVPLINHRPRIVPNLASNSCGREKEHGGPSDRKSASLNWIKNESSGC